MFQVAIYSFPLMGCFSQCIFIVRFFNPLISAKLFLQSLHCKGFLCLWTDRTCFPRPAVLINIFGHNGDFLVYLFAWTILKQTLNFLFVLNVFWQRWHSSICSSAWTSRMCLWKIILPALFVKCFKLQFTAFLQWDVSHHER